MNAWEAGAFLSFLVGEVGVHTLVSSTHFACEVRAAVFDRLIPDVTTCATLR